MYKDTVVEMLKINGQAIETWGEMEIFINGNANKIKPGVFDIAMAL